MFTRAFTRTFGLSPRAYRARSRSTTDDRSAATHAAVAIHRGPYDRLPETYLTDPGDHPDLAAWETEIA